MCRWQKCNFLKLVKFFCTAGVGVQQLLLDVPANYK